MTDRRSTILLTLRIIALGIFALPAISHATNSMMNDDDTFDQELTHEEKVKIRQLTTVEITEIDDALMSNVAPRWRKVAMVVGLSMMQFKGRFRGIPDVYYSQRIAELVAAGKLEAQGDLRRMRFSEVRTPGH
jgi:hypothetical protein